MKMALQSAISESESNVSAEVKSSQEGLENGIKEIDLNDLSVLRTVHKDYDSDLKAINSTKQEESLKVKARIKLKQDLFDKTNSEAQELKEKGDLSEKEAAQLQRLEQTLTLLENEKRKDEIELALIPEDGSQTTERLIPGFQKKITAISKDGSLTEKEKAASYDRLDDELIKSVQYEMATVEELRKYDADDKKSVEKTKELNAFLTMLRRRKAAREEVDIVEEDRRQTKGYKEFISDNNGEKESDPTKIAPSISNVDLAEVRNIVLGGEENPMEVELNTTREKKENLQDLNRYRSSLSEYAENLDAQGSDDAIKIYKEIAEIDKRKTEIEEAMVYELEVDRIKENNEAIKNDTTSDRLLTQYASIEEDLEVALTKKNIPTKEEKKLQKKLEKARVAKFEREQSLLKEELTKMKISNLDKWDALSELEMLTTTSQASFALARRHYASLQKESNTYEVDADKAKELGRQNELYKAAIQRHKNAQKILEMIYIDNKVESITAGALSTLDNFSDLREKDRATQVAVANAEADLANIEDAISRTKDAREKSDLQKKRRSKASDIERLKDELNYINKKLNIVPDRLASTIEPQARKVNLTEAEEAKIASSDLYKRLSRSINDALFLRRRNRTSKTITRGGKSNR